MKIQHFTTTLVLLIFLGWHPLFAQEKYDADPNKMYGVGYAGFLGQNPLISLEVDSGTTKICPFNFLNGENITNTNFVYLEHARQIEIFTSVEPMHFKDYRYRIIVNDTIELVHWQIPSLDKTAFHISEKLSDYVRDSLIKDIIENIPPSLNNRTRLVTLDCVNKKITVQMYDVNRPNDVSTVYIYNKPIKKPQITYGLKSIYHNDCHGVSRNFSYLSFDKHSPENSIYMDSLDNIRLFMTENDAKLIYQVYVKGTDKKGANAYPVPTNWIHQYEKGPENQELCYANIPTSFFNEPGNYEITVIPQLSGQDLKKPIRR